MAPQHKFMVFTDFDGTITLKDSNDYLTDNYGYGYARRRELNIEILEERWSFRDAFADMLKSVTTPFDECIKILVENIKLDPGFKDFYEWATANDIPVIVLSSGMEPIIRALLTHLVGPTADQIKIVANQAKINADGTWEIEFHDDSHFGHDKSLALKPWNQLPADQRPTLFYCGDGVSDLSAARETDLLFAKIGHDLITYCQREKVPFKVFSDFKDIHRDVQAVVEGKTTPQKIAEEGAKEAAEQNLADPSKK
ncbi:putative 3-phosphoserine phosphatase [Geopyxis carbonaria]|nr:putative 3-phosphoserine phosphatase [Geopyxis carbonaria]